MGGGGGGDGEGEEDRDSKTTVQPSVVGHSINVDNSGAGPIVLAVGLGGDSLDIFSLPYCLISFSLSLGGSSI